MNLLLIKVEQVNDTLFLTLISLIQNETKLGEWDESALKRNIEEVKMPSRLSQYWALCSILMILWKHLIFFWLVSYIWFAYFHTRSFITSCFCFFSLTKKSIKARKQKNSIRWSRSMVWARQKLLGNDNLRRRIQC